MRGCALHSKRVNFCRHGTTMSRLSRDEKLFILEETLSPQNDTISFEDNPESMRTLPEVRFIMVWAGISHNGELH